MRLSCTEATISLISLTSAETDDGTGAETSARTRQQRWRRRNVAKTVRYGEGNLMICGRIKLKF